MNVKELRETTQPFLQLDDSIKQLLLLLATVCLGRQWKSAPEK